MQVAKLAAAAVAAPDSSTNKVLCVRALKPAVCLYEYSVIIIGGENKFGFARENDESMTRK